MVDLSSSQSVNVYQAGYRYHFQTLSGRSGHLFASRGGLSFHRPAATGEVYHGNGNGKCIIWGIYWYLLVGGFKHLDYFSIYWECHHPNWLIFFGGGETTNQQWDWNGFRGGNWKTFPVQTLHTSPRRQRESQPTLDVQQTRINWKGFSMGSTGGGYQPFSWRFPFQSGGLRCFSDEIPPQSIHCMCHPCV